MARRKAGDRKPRGAKSRDERLELLEKKIGKKGIETANRLVKEHNADILRYAYLVLPRAAAAGGLGGRIESLLSKLDANQAAGIRRTLLAAKAGQ